MVAVDVGGTLTKIAYADATGALSGLTRLPTPVRNGGEAVVDWLAGVIADFAAAAAGRCRGFAVAAPGIVDVEAGMVRDAPNVDWVEVALRDRLVGRTSLEGTIAHDVRAGGLAEWRLGQGGGCDNLLFLPLGTGIAGAIVTDGRLLEAGGYAGEIGHLPVAAARGVACSCGLVGCLEAVASASGVVASYRRLGGRTDVVPDDGLDAQRVAELARGGDPAAVGAFALLTRGPIEALTAYVALLGPERIVIGGGLVGAADLFLEPVGRGIESQRSFHRRPLLTTARLGADAGVIGAGLIGWAYLNAQEGRDDH